MQSTFEVAAASGAYSVTVGRGLVAAVAAAHQNAICIVDAALTSTLPPDAPPCIAIEANEQNKSLEAMPGVIAELRQRKATRDTHLIAIGGGVIQDIATFAASIYMRGLPWTYMPTTLLAMADSCIGGKSSINVQGFKNLVGNFHPPVDVVIDTDYVETLDREMVVGGLFEAAKICYARGGEAFDKFLGFGASFPLTPERAAQTVHYALLTKKWFIETDEFDRKERLLLNFGHTFGHAIEAASDFAVSHGIAVGLGMLTAIDFARASGVDSPLASRLDRHVRDALLGAALTAPPVLDLDLILQKFESDKKHRQDVYRAVLPRQQGELALVALPRDAATRAAIRQAFQNLFNGLGWACR